MGCCYIDTCPICPRRGGRVVEGAALEMLYRGNFIEGSNPSLSVSKTGPRPVFFCHQELIQIANSPMNWAFENLGPVSLISRNGR
jgi:hypothetical protein